MDQNDIDALINDFVNVSKRADALGLDLIELPGAHGYLLHQFLSPLSNNRDDQYGGNLENRMRLLLDVFKAVRAEFSSEKPVGVRVSATDWVEGGWDLAQTIEMSAVTLAFSDGCKEQSAAVAVSPDYFIICFSSQGKC
ncbi:hypothetical protein [Psychrobacter sp. NPDC078631]|uniref:oxidoreductase n=1 Tax=Psychrobacter sp. NPDC078631 TaxID=3390666 RepID=UPI003CFF9457